VTSVSEKIPPRRIRYQAAIIQNDRMLLLKIEDGARFWIIPGGGLEPPESETECVAREVLEETHLTIEVERLLLDKSVPPNDYHYVRQKTYLCTIVSGEAKPGIEPEMGDVASPIKGIGWFDLRHPDTWDFGNHEPSNAQALLHRIRSTLDY